MTVFEGGPELLPKNAFVDPGKIQQIDLTALTDSILEECFDRVYGKYEKLAEKFKGDNDERDLITIW